MARECETQPDSRQRTRLEHFGLLAGSAGLESGSAAPNQVRMSERPAHSETSSWFRARTRFELSRRGALALEDELCDLDRVQCCALAEVVAREAEGEAALDGPVAADPPDED